MARGIWRVDGKEYYFTDEKMSVYMLKTLWTWVLTAIAGAASCCVTKQIPLTGIPGFIVYGLTASVISVTIYAAEPAFCPSSSRPSGSSSK